MRQVDGDLSIEGPSCLHPRIDQNERLDAVHFEYYALLNVTEVQRTEIGPAAEDISGGGH